MRGSSSASTATASTRRRRRARSWTASSRRVRTWRSAPGSSTRGGYRSTRIRRGGIRWLSFLLRVLGGLHITDPTSGLRAFGTRALALLCEVYPDEYPEPESNLLLGRAGLRLVEVPVKMRARDGGQSSLGGWTAIYYPVKVTFALVVEALRRPAR